MLNFRKKIYDKTLSKDDILLLFEKIIHEKELDLSRLNSVLAKNIAERQNLEMKYRTVLSIIRSRFLSLFRSVLLKIPGVKLASRICRKLINKIKIKKYRKLITRSGLFDVEYYLKNNQDIKNYNIDPLDHFILYGGDDRRNPNSTFDMRYYSLAFPELMSRLSVNPLVHYICHGFQQDIGLVASSERDIEVVSQAIMLPRFENPMVSIIIPVESAVRFILQCLQSISSIKSKITYEVVVVSNQALSDLSILRKIDSLHLVSSPKKLNYIESCNYSAQYATGEFLVFLKDTVKVFPGWIDELIGTFEYGANIGAVVSKILYPNGRIKEVGRKLSGTDNFLPNGSLQYFDKPEFDFLQEVDCCALNAIMIPKSKISNYGMFDEKYIAEEAVAADFAFNVKKHGDLIVCQPLSTIEQYTPVSCGIIQFPEDDIVRLDSKWSQFALKRRTESNKVSGQFYNKEDGGRLLSIDRMPKPDNDAGSAVTCQFLNIFSQLGFQVTFIPDDLKWAGHYTMDLQRKGVECLYTPYISSVYSHLVAHGKRYDVVHLHRVHIAGKYINMIRQLCPNAKIVFFVCDLHWLREERQAELTRSVKLLETAKQTKQTELSVIRKSDAVVVYSDLEYDILRQEVEHINLKCIPLIFEIPGCQKQFSEREGIVFVGGYKHQPNIDAVISFVNDTWPVLKRRIPDLTFYVLGSDVPEEILRLNGNGVEIVGYVENLGDYFDLCRLSVVPLRFGAGIKGKIGTSLSYGVPVVSTPVGVEGMALQPNKEIIVAENGIDFVDAVERLYTDEQLWQSVSNAGLYFLREHYSLDAGKRHIVDLLNSVDRYNVTSDQLEH
jgi:glycosyltransferase involved in cell wall biosynthesis